MKDTNSPDIRIKYEKFDKIITIVYSYKMGNMESSKFTPPPTPQPSPPLQKKLSLKSATSFICAFVNRQRYERNDGKHKCYNLLNVFEVSF